jgi:hypothetical protein
MLIGVVSDTHGQVDFARRAVRTLESRQVQVVIHCGDIGSPAIVPLFRHWPTHYVFGNVDSDSQRLRAAIAAGGQHCHERFGAIELEAVRIAFLHGDDSRLFRETTRGGRWNLVCYGHTHVAEHHFEGSTLVLNPGALYRANPHSLALVELSTLEVTTVRL